MKTIFISLLFIFLTLSDGWTYPVDKFTSPFQLNLLDSRVRSKSVDSINSLGHGLSVVAERSGRGIVAVETNLDGTSGRLSYRGAPQSGEALKLSWDGDSNVEILSAAGLGCIDLKSDKSRGFVFRGMKRDLPQNKEVNLWIEIKGYDGSDPSGQRYSSTTIKRALTSKREDVYIPFSTLTKEGPNGPWNPQCLGALEVTFSRPGGDELEFSIDSIVTDGRCPYFDREGRPSCEQAVMPTPTFLPTVTPNMTSPAIIRTATPIPNIP